MYLKRIACDLCRSQQPLLADETERFKQVYLDGNTRRLFLPTDLTVIPEMNHVHVCPQCVALLAKIEKKT